MAAKVGIVAFSGGLDTSFLVPFSREEYGLEKVVTVTVNTGGFSDSDLARIGARAREVGSDEHVTISGEEHFYTNIIRFLIFGNVTRDGYPLCVGAERFTQAAKVLEVCQQYGATHFIHGSTGAGNDQYRFDLAALVMGQSGLEIVAPVRERGFSREYETQYLKDRGIAVETKNSLYSYNVGLWGVSIGGKETHSSTELIPETAWYTPIEQNLPDAVLNLHFERGEVVSLGGPGLHVTGPVDVIAELARVGGRYGIGRHYHIGTSIPGKKGRIAYESPAADIIYEAHRTLEKITLTQLQIQGKRGLADEFGRLVHEAKYLDPFTDDIRAFLEHTQRRVSGTCTVHLAPGFIRGVTADSPFNLLNSTTARYGEASSFYDGRDARGAVRLHALEQVIYHRAGGVGGEGD